MPVSAGDVGAVLAGAFTDMGIAYASQQVAPTPIVQGDFPVYTSDVVGDIVGATALIAGAVTKNQKLALFGAGGLGLSLANFLNRALKTYTPYKASAQAIEPGAQVPGIGIASLYPPVEFKPTANGNSVPTNTIMF